MTLGSLAFLNPALLAGLAALPLIYWLLRTTPPLPKRIDFPATRILVGLETPEKQPATTPWWLVLIRMLAAALVILALAEPILNPPKRQALGGNGPVAIVVDNGWASGTRWLDTQRMVTQVIGEAESQGRSVVIVPTALQQQKPTFRIDSPAQARSTAAAMQPQPMDPNRAEALEALRMALGSADGVSVVWLTDGIDHDGKTSAAMNTMVSLAKGGTPVVIDVDRGKETLAVAGDLVEGGRLEAIITRAMGAERQGSIYAVNARGQRIGEAPYRFSSGQTSTRARIDVPLEIRNQIARLEVAGERTPGAVHLLDARAKWHRVGLISGASREQAQPLLAPLFYIERALQPFAELAKTEEPNTAKAIEDLLKRNVTVLMLADVGLIPAEVKDKLSRWVARGGVLVRFAGPRLESGGDALVPVPLRTGGRALGGALSWSTPQPLAPMTDDSIFAGLAVPADTFVTRQVLADPARLGNDVRIWSRLRDGTPLVTAAARGEGQIVLFHVTADAEWSNVPLSGLFVDMLRRISTLGRAQGLADERGEVVNTTQQNEINQTIDRADVLAPVETLDGFGILRPPPPTARAIAATALSEARPTLDHPPGLYGAAASPRALNIATPKTTLAPLPALPSGFERRVGEENVTKPLKPHLMGTALALLLIDIIAVLALAGALAPLFAALGRRSTQSAQLLIVTLAIGALMATSASAQTNRQDRLRDSQANPGVAQRPPPALRQPNPTGPDAAQIKATSVVTFANVITGNAQVDNTARAGLRGLSLFLTRHTAIEPGEPTSVDIERDEIAFYPLLYWPVLANPAALKPETLAKIDAYMKGGGMIVFDTRDAGTDFLNSVVPNRDQQGGTPLQKLLGSLDLPRIEPVPENHVLTKAFYLIQRFPGRYDNGRLWVEAETPGDRERGRQSRRVDGVSTILITANDLAGAWAVDERGQPMFPISPGGEQQREFAFRTGVNIVMYALTGNYKADQVHVSTILERLGQ
ncbi:MAG: putative double rane protein precursor [Pseudomonadota bacterium]